MEDIYVRISESEKEVEFADTWDVISYKRGRKKKFKGNEQRKAIRYIMDYWKNFTEYEINRWKAPEWLKERHFKINTKNNVYVTIEDNGDMVIEFEINHSPIIIRKSPLFYDLYDRYLYLYEKILFIAQSTNFNEIKIHTDLVDLLRINRIYWRDVPYNVQAYVYVEKKTNLNFKSNWNGGRKYYDR